MFRKTVRVFKRRVRSLSGRSISSNPGDPWEVIHRETYWFLFIPIYVVTEFIKQSNR